MDILSLQSVTSPVIKAAEQSLNAKKDQLGGGNEDLFGSLLNSAIDNINQTSAYSEAAKAEKIKLAMGETENAHDLTIALNKSSTALTYTIAVRDKFLEAYKEIMNMQV